jgi:hypothetical protein
VGRVVGFKAVEVWRLQEFRVADLDGVAELLRELAEKRIEISGELLYPLWVAHMRKRAELEHQDGNPIVVRLQRPGEP